jgi:membrane-associated HD superfamily phosphohydrolase
MQILVALHSLNRFVLLILLLVVIVKSFMGWLNKSPFEKADDKLSLFLFISTHTQLLLGLILYFFGSAVIFSSASMKEAVARYWLVEHASGMLIAIVLISLGRILSKKLSDSTAKHKRMFTYNIAALAIILAIIGLSHRGFFSVSW